VRNLANGKKNNQDNTATNSKHTIENASLSDLANTLSTRQPEEMRIIKEGFSLETEKK
jgi:hypothetical protein